jgi:CMP/dCMP kinase
MSIPSVIAIDGPAASGKSTLALRLAAELDYLYFDTGVIYRAVTQAALQRRLDLQDEVAVTALAENTRIDIQPPSQSDGRPCDVLVEGQDVTWAIRATEVERHVSLVSAYPGVRAALTAQQRRVGQRGRVVMVGRDIGTVVMPDADLKIYLDASAEERARRRHQELLDRSQTTGYSGPSYEQILAEMRQRDLKDSSRAVAPLRPADDARILQSDGLDADQVLQLCLAWIRQ